MKAVLGLEDGTFVVGNGFGVEGACSGELVFTTQMTGYMEALTDPSYAGQLLMFTYPLIGNYGVDLQNFESPRVHARGCIAREIAAAPAAEPSVAEYFEENGLLGISGVDTRSLTIKTRTSGTLRASLIVGSEDGEEAVRRARAVSPISDVDLIGSVSCPEPYRISGPGKRIAVIDLGVKRHILASLNSRGADIHVFSHTATPDEVMAAEPDALFITNGPGDPRRATHAIRCIRDLTGELPVIGICMGIQVAALALGAETYKMKFGHRGTNQPVRYQDGCIYITTQNHGFAVDEETLPEGCAVSYRNVNDGTVEGFENADLNITCVQFHPEAHGGPRDTEIHFFDRIYKEIP
ncbi:MAG: Carbamoyl-phosphate synthase small chain [Methanoculleus marisnigri]|jgi:carbamoyl-phosphate synthase, small subunit|uniref:Carbamoyl phosphate synthase small chain n=1 Tax=Methanoculleus marisnigri TaxID=2198 RepID=A0A124G4P0_9EURY|nr:glutamine-hydrolyzing carbamoyl-phosphate synthase small subunit [Methanoculleus marisnigri]KUK61551.1 MAG: Carbamoyl-phosphate synthase small chain [Methanoculleus marisnigri]KUL00676.1 MAG: Carbamoyl-phosphate synthase small chain [Methanoculleus marisnigri]